MSMAPRNFGGYPTFIFLVASLVTCSVRAQCPCLNGGTCSGENCSCPAGWTGKRCQRPCVDFYKSCKAWDEEKRCEWTRGLTNFFLDNCPVTCNQCVFDAKTVPVGLPLPPILEPLKGLVGIWRTETDFPDRYPIPFASGGYRELIEIAIAEVPGFDTPSLNYTATAVSLLDENDQLSEIGFLWMKPSKESTKLIGNMMTTNSGLTVIQEGVLDFEVIHFNSTTYSQAYPSARNPDASELNPDRTLDFASPDSMVQTVRGSNGKTYTKTYKRVPRV